MSILIFVNTQVGFSRILSTVRIPGIDKGIFEMGNNTNSVVAQGLSEFRYVWFVNIKSVINLDYILIYLVLIDDSRASVYLDGIDRRILVPSVPVMGGWNTTFIETLRFLLVVDPLEPFLSHPSWIQKTR